MKEGMTTISVFSEAVKKPICKVTDVQCAQSTTEKATELAGADREIYTT